MFGDIVLVIIAVFLWLALPALIAKSKGRRWWVWVLLSILFPGFTIMLAIFMHPSDANGIS